ncbi:hypothetical protein F2Q70_00005081 [Brassica cretica]|nr:hypothetical protein F2Q68_00021723 [Brassica cretica]KAF2574693.1 hypothetical protein F2Q70_00005081 [Brassica cretica]
MHFLHESHLSPNQLDPTSASSSTGIEEGHRRDESRKPRAEFQEEQARVLAASLCGRDADSLHVKMASSSYAFNNRFASKELQVARLTSCGFVEKTSVGFIPEATKGTYSPNH